MGLMMKTVEKIEQKSEAVIQKRPSSALAAEAAGW
jgi:hypothetical protein